MGPTTVSINVDGLGDGPDDELRLLATWLRDEDQLRGRVSLVHRPISEGEMGGALDTVQVMLTSSTASTFVTSVFAWLTQRRTSGRVSLRSIRLRAMM